MVALLLKHSCLPIESLAHSSSKRSGILLCGRKTPLLGYDVVHDGHEPAEAVGFLDEHPQFLGAGQLHFVAYDAQLLLGSCEVFDALHFGG